MASILKSSQVMSSEVKFVCLVPVFYYYIILVNFYVCLIVVFSLLTFLIGHSFDIHVEYYI